MAFKDTLRRLLDEKDMKAVDLAKAANISEAIVSVYLKGDKEPKGKTSVSIAKALEVTLDELWQTGMNDKKPAVREDNELDPATIALAKRLRQLDAASLKLLSDHADLLLKYQQEKEGSPDSPDSVP